MYCHLMMVISKYTQQHGARCELPKMLPSNRTNKYLPQQPARQSPESIKNNYVTCLFSHRLLEKFNMEK